jgi:sugar phosphate isomerase/epimerase
MKKPCPISVQLYSVREAAAKDFPAVLRRIANMGYVGVEFAGLHGMSPDAVRRLLDELGLVTSSAHGPMPTEANVAEVIATARTLGYSRHVAGFGPAQFASTEEILKAADIVTRAAALLQGSGISLGIHNHWWEFDRKIDGAYPHEIFMKAVPAAVFAEVDTYWAKVGGADPAAVVKKYGKRAPLLHIKDGPGNNKDPHTAVGQGVMDWKTVFAAASPATEWAIVELDHCATDMFEAVAASYRYLVGNGYAKGRK